jgi:hypothetical protein
VVDANGKAGDDVARRQRHRHRRADDILRPWPQASGRLQERVAASLFVVLAS